MLYTLLSPAESKEAGGSLASISPKSFIFPTLYEKRFELLQKFENYKKTLDEKKLLEFFDLKSLDKTSEYRDSVFELSTEKAVLRYSGVAYKALDFYSLPSDAKKYILDNVVIFSNLFGPLLAGDEVPNYKLKQGAKIDGIDGAKHYKKEFSSALDDMFEGAELLDLLAGYYEKFYTPKVRTLKPKFLKGGKVVSHNAKEHRGLYLRAVAMSGASSIDDILSLKIDNLKLIEILQKGNILEPVFETSNF
jgi:uncharacterized protein